MALSNMSAEPKREITESVVGITFFALFLFLDWKFAVFQSHAKWGGMYPALAMFAVPVISSIGMAVTWVLLYGLAQFTHGLGDLLCDALGSMGLDPRPRWRSNGKIKYVDYDGRRICQIDIPDDENFKAAISYGLASRKYLGYHN